MKTLEELKQEYIAARIAQGSIGDALVERRKESSDQIEAITKQWSLENAELLKMEDEVNDRVTNADSDLRNAVVRLYATNLSEGITGKTLAEGLSVQVRTKFKVLDDVAAIQWAKVNAPILVKESIDAKEMEKLAKGKDLDFVEFTESVSAVIKL